MKTLLCNVGVLTLLIAPFMIIPAFVIGYGLFLFGNEELGLWICGGASAASLILGPLTFRTFCKWKRQSPGSLRGDNSASTEPGLNLVTNASEDDFKHSQTIEKREDTRYESTWPGTFCKGRTNKLVLLSKRGCSVRTQSAVTCGEIGPC